MVIYGFPRCISRGAQQAVVVRTIERRLLDLRRALFVEKLSIITTFLLPRYAPGKRSSSV